MTSTLFKFLLLGIALFQCACSTIMKEDWEELTITSTPPGAVVQVSNGLKCHTPCHLELERRDKYRLTIDKEGYQSQNFSVSGHSWDGWLWGNLVFLVGFPIAIGIDFYTGYAYDLSPDEIQVELKK